MKFPGTGNQNIRHYLYSVDGTVAAGGTAQLVLAQSMSRCFLFLGNNSTGPLYFEIGSGRATATLTSGAVSSVTINNAGFNYTNPPLVRFLGGGREGNSSYLGLNQPGGNGPSNVALGHAVLSGGAISSIVVDNGGANYAIAPYVLITNSDLDPYGCAAPSTTSGLLIPAGGFLKWDGSSCPTDPIAVYGATTGQTFVCRWMD